MEKQKNNESLHNQLIITILKRTNKISDKQNLLSQNISHLQETIIFFKENQEFFKKEILKIKEEGKINDDNEKDFIEILQKRILFLENEYKKRTIIDEENIKHKNNDIKRLKFLYALIIALFTMFGFQLKDFLIKLINML